MQKRILLISRHAPYGSSIAREALDAVLASAAYDQQISLLFMDDGVFQLLAEQDPGSIGQKSFASMLSALPLYDVTNILDRKSTRLNSSHVRISYAVFCLKKTNSHGKHPVF